MAFRYDELLVGASPAVPLALTPVTIKNYAGLPGAAVSRIVPRIMEDLERIRNRAFTTQPVFRA